MVAITRTQRNKYKCKILLRIPWSLGTEKSLFYNMAGAKRNGATTFIELIRGGSTHCMKQISTGQKLFMSSR